MFGSWQVGSSPTFRHSPSIRKACKNCRAKKVKCTGQLSGCQRCETLDIECTYTNNSGKRRRGSLDTKGAKKSDELGNRRPRQVTKRSVTEANRAQSPLPDTIFVSDITIVEDPEPINRESTFAADSAEWSLFTAFDPDPSATDGSAFVAAPSTSHDIDLVFWTDTPASAPGGGTRSSEMTDQNRTTPGDSSSGHTTICACACELTEARPEPDLETQVQRQTKTQTRTSSRGPGQLHWQEQNLCSCLQRIVFLINELETGVSNIEEDDPEDNSDDIGGDASLNSKRGLDSALGLHKEALRYGESMRRCCHCSYRAETPILLLLLTNRLTVLCTDMVSTYHDATQASRRSSALPCEMPFTIMAGEYEVDSDIERGAMLRELIAFQLRALRSFVNCLSDSQDPQGTDFAAAKTRVLNLLQRLHNEQRYVDAPIDAPEL